MFSYSKHLFCSRTLENIAHRNAIEHAFSNVTKKEWKMARATPCCNPYLAGNWCIGSDQGVVVSIDGLELLWIGLQDAF